MKEEEMKKSKKKKQRKSKAVITASWRRKGRRRLQRSHSPVILEVGLDVWFVSPLLPPRPSLKA